MIVKRIGAVVVAAAMIIVALIIRPPGGRADPAATDDGSTITADSTSTTAAPKRETTDIVCTPDLAAACNRAAATATANGTTVSITVIDADSTLANPAEAPAVWVTLDPLPAAIEAADPSVSYTTTAVAASPLALIVAADRADVLTAACGAPVSWQCLGDNAGRPWTTIDGQAGWSTLRPGLSPSSTAIGVVSITAAVRSYFGSTSITAADPTFITWGRQLGGAVSPSTLSTGTAVGTIQVRPSTLDIAVGAPAELARVDDARFAVVDVGAAAEATVVVAAREDNIVSAAFTEALSQALSDDGWSPTTAAAASPYTGGDVIAALGAWKDVQK